MGRSFTFCAFLCAVAGFVLMNCNNYDLLDKLENPGAVNQSFSQGTGRRIFVTAGTYNAILGGSGGADTKCIADAGNPMGPGNGNWKALIAGGGRLACTTANCSGGVGENLNWVLLPNTRYIRPDGVTIGYTNDRALLIFPLENSIAPLATTFAWTGFINDWTYSVSCGDWTSSTGTGNRGQVDSLTDTAIVVGTQTCGVSERLYCVEQ